MIEIAFGSAYAHLSMNLRTLMPLSISEFRIKKEIRSSGHFDSEYYLSKHIDLSSLKSSAALKHFVKFGMAEGRQPSEAFDAKYYLATVPGLSDYKSAFLHYIRCGKKEGRLGSRPTAAAADSFYQEITASGYFDWQFYAMAYTDVPSASEEALEHFLSVGMSLGRQPSMQFCPEDYCSENPKVSSRADALMHCIRNSGTSPPRRHSNQLEIDYALQSIKIKASELFDPVVYAQQQPVAALEGWDPVMHYLATGSQFCSEVSSTVSLIAYLARYPDIRASGLNPLLHWLDSGLDEGRQMPSTEAAKIWSNRDYSCPLPDDCIHFELIAGQRFFRGYGFDFKNRHVKGYVSKCVDALSHAATEVADTILGKTPPRVSIIIPVYGQMDYILSCLDSLRAHRSAHSFEIIVCDDASPDESEMLQLASIPWIRYIRRKKNGGFIECCNYAASNAIGEVLVFLNSDTRVVESWLDELIWGFDNLEKAGLVGSKLLNSDGTLQEAGGIIFNNGTAHNYGRDQNPNEPSYCFSRQADYISGAAIGITRILWNEIGGFDPHFAPAYCEDVDLAFKVRKAGYKVWYQPFSRVVHYEGITHGRDVSSGIKAYQSANLLKIRVRYADELTNHAPATASPHDAANFRHKTRMLVVDALTPTPDRDSGSIMTAEVMKTYRKLGFEQHFVSAYFPQWVEKYSRQLQRDGACCHYFPFSPTIGSIAKITDQFELALIYRHDVAQLVLEKIRSKMPSARVIFANVDLHYLREMRSAEVSGNQRTLANAEFTKTSELNMFAKADAAFVHTDAELKIIRSELPTNLDNIIVFPWMAEAIGAKNGFGQRHNLMFLGNFLHTPNIDSAIYLVTEIWPLLLKQLPTEAKLYIVGNMPTPEVIGLSSDRIIVTGFVEDMTPYFEASRVFVAPLRYGAGIKGKIVTSFAHGVPCVATPVAAEGIGAPGAPHIAVEYGVESFARATLKLYADENEWVSTQRAAFLYLENSYSRTKAERLCIAGFDIAGKVWKKRYEYRRISKLHKIMEQQGD